jgi:hypothetical protein
MSKPNEVIRRTDKLVGFENATAMKGTLQCVFFSRYGRVQELSSVEQLVDWVFPQGSSQEGAREAAGQPSAGSQGKRPSDVEGS